MPDYQLDLSGTWTLAVGGRDIDFVTVPGTFPPIGRRYAASWPR